MADAVNDKLIAPGIDAGMPWVLAHPVESGLAGIVVGMALLWGFIWLKGKIAEVEEGKKLEAKSRHEARQVAPLPAPATADEIAQAVAAKLRDDDSLVAGIAAKLNSGDEKPITERAVATFLRTLGEEEVAPTDLPAKLDSIAANHRRLLQELAVLHPTNAQAAALVAEAAQAAEQGERARVDQLLAEAGALEDGDIDRLESVLDERRKNAARIEAERARNALAGLDHETAARHFEAAADKLGQTEPRLRGILLDGAAREWLVLGQVSKANALLPKVHEVMTELAALAPDDFEAQRDLWVSHTRMGDILYRQDNSATALDHYHAGLDIAQVLADRNSSDITAQRDLSISHNKMGDIHVRRDDPAKALEYYQASLDIRQALADRDPGNANAQRDLSVSHERMGDILRRQADPTAALDHYQAGLKIWETFATRDPTDSRALRDLFVGHNKIGDLLARLDDSAKVLNHYHAGLYIAQVLADRDSTNAEAQMDLAKCHGRLALMDPDHARVHAEAVREICRGLLACGAWHEHLDRLENLAAEILADKGPSLSDPND